MSDPEPLTDPSQDDRPTLPDGTWDRPYEPGPPVAPALSRPRGRIEVPPSG